MQQNLHFLQETSKLHFILPTKNYYFNDEIVENISSVLSS